jgi:hypothetical protein
MKIFTLLFIVMIAGCSSYPIKPPFPDASSQLANSCDPLSTLPNVTATHEVKLSEVSKIIVINYDKANKCAVLVEGWKEWYIEQKKIYEGLK